MAEEEPRSCLSRLAGRQLIVQVLEAAGAGPAARCTGMVRGGRVAIDGQVNRDPQARADPFRQQITLDGEPLSLENTCRYLALNKPYGVLSSFTDPEGRPTLAHYVPLPGVYAAGRLDLDSEGLVLLTGDGWLSHRLSHPRYHQPKTYLVQVEGVPGREALAALRGGVEVKGRQTAPASVEMLAEPPDLPPRPVPIRERQSIPTAWLRLVLTEGRKRQVRHMTAAVGHPTLRLVRVAIGPVRLGDLAPGEWRDLTPGELEALGKSLSVAARQAGSAARKAMSASRRGAGRSRRRGRTQ
jgi:23S rRNA pseudouridine2457 synthase